jgi:hypothetical protein
MASSHWSFGVMTFCALALAGCGDDDEGPPGPDIAGIYEVTHHTLNETACDAEGPDVSDPPFIRLELQQIVGIWTYGFSPCDSADPGSCFSLGILSTAFTSSDGSAWHGDITSSNGGDEFGVCKLTASRSLARPTAEGVHMEFRSSSGEAPDLTGEACDPDAARARAESFPCNRFEVFDGRKAN